LYGKGKDARDIRQFKPRGEKPKKKKKYRIQTQVSKGKKNPQSFQRNTGRRGRNKENKRDVPKLKGGGRDKTDVAGKPKTKETSNKPSTTHQKRKKRKNKHWKKKSI